MIVHPSTSQVVVVDPGEATPVIETLQRLKLNLAAILVTHHHYDHTHGITELLNFQQAPVYSAATLTSSHIHLSSLKLDLRVLVIPGHTLDHLAYIAEGMVFTGDTLFTGGCGRLFEGKMVELWHSLKQLSQLPPNTLIYCGHEYTVQNLKFALQVEPDNLDLQARLESAIQKRAQGLPTVPSRLELEIKTNPFLRCHLPSVKESVEAYWGEKMGDALAVFDGLRRWKDKF